MKEYFVFIYFIKMIHCVKYVYLVLISFSFVEIIENKNNEALKSKNIILDFDKKIRFIINYTSIFLNSL